MVLRIDRITESEFVVMTLSGHLALEELADLRRLLEAECAQTLIVDLADVIQVDRDAASFLASVEAEGVQLRHCPAYSTGVDHHRTRPVSVARGSTQRTRPMVAPTWQDRRRPTREDASSHDIW